MPKRTAEQALRDEANRGAKQVKLAEDAVARIAHQQGALTTKREHAQESLKEALRQRDNALAALAVLTGENGVVSVPTGGHEHES